MSEAVFSSEQGSETPAGSGDDLRVMASDPWAWCIALPVLFGALAAIRLTIPSAPYFDEVHYLPAARELLSGGEYLNREHPLLGKELIALGIYLLGDNPLGWRIMPLIAGIITVGAGMRAIWHASHERFAVIAYGVLLATGFHIFVHARIAILDIFMLCFLALAAWQFTAAIREPETGRWRLALTGIAIGCALASKWNAVPLAMAPGLTFFAARLSAGRRRLVFSKRGVPVPGISLAEAFVWLGVLPMAIYSATFIPGYWLTAGTAPSPLSQLGLIGLHQEIIALQQQVITPHSYQSTWAQWVTNTRGIWYLYEFTDGAQRGVLLIGNPLTMLLGLPALLWCLVTGFGRNDWAKVGIVIGYGVSLGLWLIAPKPVQFYYHYAVPSCFLLAALALFLSDLHGSARHRWISYAALGASTAVFAIFFPILTAAPLDGPMSFANWTWIAGWR
ncbi:phospholipid carrier-dependent glycosyltransferase [Erythrobacter insulae]|uniref:Polyprenol-phosphate-mannose--protein mannosyltransferase n=1 Tax=Erythrobacter insulae TaxID=2584124 RepID=A0A547PDT2_9SPHN|nr:phospholipid carrier-dependent glycosyltransferase [Erythrobacter insulae]TRD12298.1 phospholipid carrier-dependent glycosyltransferase [Erythrobacter insulae]